MRLIGYWQLSNASLGDTDGWIQPGIKLINVFRTQLTGHFLQAQQAVDIIETGVGVVTARLVEVLLGQQHIDNVAGPRVVASLGRFQRTSSSRDAAELQERLARELEATRYQRDVFAEQALLSEGSSSSSQSL